MSKLKKNKKTNKSLYEQLFYDTIKIYPSFGIYLGLIENQKHIENPYSKVSENKMKKLINKYKKKYNKYKKNNKSLKEINQYDDIYIDDKILEWSFDNYKLSKKFNFDYMPVSSYHNEIIDFTIRNTSFYPLKTKKDLVYLISRFHDYYDIILSIKNELKKNLKKRIIIPKIIVQQTINSLKSFVNSDDSLYIPKIPQNLINKNKNIYNKFIKFMKTKYKKRIEELIKYLEDVYIKKARNTIGLYGIPNGKNYYKFLIKNNTTLDISPKEIMKYGKSEVKRIEGEMNKLKVKLSYPKNMKLLDFYEKVKNDKKSYYKNRLIKGKSKSNGSYRKNIVKGYKNLKLKIKKNIINKQFIKNVKNYKIQPVNKSLETSSAGAFYISPSYFSIGKSRPGVFYINLRSVKENPKYSMLALSLHEGKPGHHYHHQYMVDNKVPVHRAFGVDNTGLVEGWGLYCESLGNYSDSELFGRYTYELMRSVRLVVDTGIHYFGWSYNKALNYMIKHIPMEKSELESELIRYICIPGQAVCYKLGEREIFRLRKIFEEKHGTSLEKRKIFHKLMMEDGILPFSLLEEKIINYNLNN